MIQRLKKREDFIRIRRAKLVRTKGFMLQVAKGVHGQMRVGFTCSKKVGNAVARNRAKRRLRALSEQVLARHGCSGFDYVLIGYKDMTANLPFEMLKEELSNALRRAHRE